MHTRGTLDVRYSSEALSLANSLGGRYVSFNGWQELERKAGRTPTFVAASPSR